MKCRMTFKDDRMYMNILGVHYTVYNYIELDSKTVGNVLWRTKENYKSFCQRMRLGYVGI